MTSLNTILNEQAAQITSHGTPVHHSERVYCVTFSPDGRHLVSGSVNRQVNVWEVGATELSGYMQGHTKFVWSLAFSPDGKTLASTSGDGSVFLWDMESRSHFRIEESHYAIILPLYGVDFSPTGKYFAAGCSDGIVRLWSTSSRRPPWKLKGHKSEVYSVAFSPDGRFLASGGNDFTVRIWDVKKKSEEEIMTRHGCRVTSVIYSPDGRLLAYASTDKQIYIINLASGQSQTLQGHQDIVWSIAFSPDSRLLLSGSNDHSVRLWDVESGQQVQILEGHQDEVNSVAFSPDGLMAASASNDQTVRVWDLTLFKQRPETYLKLITSQKKASNIDKKLLNFINFHRQSLKNSWGSLDNLETSIKWLRSTLKTENSPPLGLVHDLGLVLTSENDAFFNPDSGDSPYRNFLLELHSAPIIEELKKSKLSSLETGILIAHLLAGLEFSNSFPLPENRPLVQSCRLLEAALQKDIQTQKNSPGNAEWPFFKSHDQEIIKRRLLLLSPSKIRFLKDLYANPKGALDTKNLSAIVPAESLPPALTELYSQLLSLAPRLTFNNHRGSQAYSCGGYHGLTHKGALDNLSLSEHLYAKSLLQHRILNREALYYGRDGESEKRRRITLIITQSGLEMSGTGNHLAKALTLTVTNKMQDQDGDLRQTFFSNTLSPTTDPLTPNGRQQILSWKDDQSLNLRQPLTALKEQLRSWLENYHRIDTLWIIDRHFAADHIDSRLKKMMQEINNLSRNQAWFISLTPESPKPPAAADLFHQYQQVVVENDKITLK